MFNLSLIILGRCGVSNFSFSCIPFASVATGVGLWSSITEVSYSSSREGSPCLTTPRGSPYNILSSVSTPRLCLLLSTVSRLSGFCLAGWLIARSRAALFCWPQYQGSISIQLNFLNRIWKCCFAVTRFTKFRNGLFSLVSGVTNWSHTLFILNCTTVFCRLIDAWW